MKYSDDTPMLLYYVNFQNHTKDRVSFSSCLSSTRVLMMVLIVVIVVMNRDKMEIT